MPPLSLLSEDEKLFQASVRDFARSRIAPLSRAMDDAAALDKPLLTELFALGLMGIEVAEEHGDRRRVLRFHPGHRGRQVDPSVAWWSTFRTRSSTTRWPAGARRRSRALPAPVTPAPWRLCFRGRPAGARARGGPRLADRPQPDQQRPSRLFGLRHDRSDGFTAALRRFWSNAAIRAQVGRRTSSASAPQPPAKPFEGVVGRRPVVGDRQGYKVAIESSTKTRNRQQMVGLAQAPSFPWLPSSGGVRAADQRVPGGAV